MNKWILWALKPIVCTVVLFSLGSCSSPEPGQYENKEKGFAIEFPESWQIKEAEMGLDVIALSPPEGPMDEFQENLSVASSLMTGPLSADEILDANIPGLMRMVTDFKPAERVRLEINGVPAARLDYTQRQGQFKLTVSLYALPGRSRAYLIYCTQETAAAPRFRERFDKIISSFRVTK